MTARSDLRMETARYLASTIGPRPPASPAEGQAAEWIASRLRTIGFQAAVEPFRGPRSFGSTYLVLYALFPAAAALHFVHPWAGAVVGSLALAATLLELDGSPVLSRFTATGDSRNVVGTRAAAGAVEQRVVLCAHMDTSRSGLLWHPALVGSFRGAFVCLLLSMCATIVVLLVGALAPPLPAVLVGLLVVLAGYLGVSWLLLFHREVFGRQVAGAGDNASGVAVALDAAERLGVQPRTEVIVLASGCEESGLVGMRQFLSTHKPDVASTYVINIDNCGTGRVHYIRSEGMARPYRCSPELLAAARRASDAEPALGVTWKAFHVMNSDSLVPLSRGYRALTIMAFDERGRLPNWHWPSDTVDTLDPSSLEAASDLVVRMVRELDRCRPGEDRERCPGCGGADIRVDDPSVRAVSCLATLALLPFRVSASRRCRECGFYWD